MKLSKYRFVLPLLLVSLPAFSLLASASSHPTGEETCATLSSMLYDVKLNQRRYSQIEYQLMEQILKQTIEEKCESGDRGYPGQGRDSGGFPAYSSGQPMLRDGNWILPNGQKYGQSPYTDASRGYVN